MTFSTGHRASVPYCFRCFRTRCHDLSSCLLAWASENVFNYSLLAGRRWLTPVILATQEAAIRIAIRTQPGEIGNPYLIKKNRHKKRAGGVAQDVGPEFKPQYRKEKKKPASLVLLPSFRCPDSAPGPTQLPRVRPGSVPVYHHVQVSQTAFTPVPLKPVPTL
jgi:hypothetical protein